MASDLARPAPRLHDTARRLNINPAGRVATKPTEPEAPMSYYARQRLLEGRHDDDAAN